MVRARGGGQNRNREVRIRTDVPSGSNGGVLGAENDRERASAPQIGAIATTTELGSRSEVEPEGREGKSAGIDGFTTHPQEDRPMKPVVAFAADWPEVDRSSAASWQQHGAAGLGAQQERPLSTRVGEGSEHPRASIPVQNAPRAAMQAVSKSQDRNRSADTGIEKSSPSGGSRSSFLNLSYQNLPFSQANWEVETSRRWRIRIATAITIARAERSIRYIRGTPALVSRYELRKPSSALNSWTCRAYNKG